MAFERFSERARKLFRLSRDEAVRYRHDCIGTEHLLVAVILEGGGVGARTLTGFGVEPLTLRAAVEKLASTGTAVPTGQLPFTDGAKKVLALSLEEARALDDDYIGTQHVLLGLIRESEGVAAKVLGGGLGLTAEQVRAKVVDLVAGDRLADGPLQEPAASGNRLRWLGLLGLLGLLGFVDVRLGYLGFLGFLGFLGALLPSRRRPASL